MPGNLTIRSGPHAGDRYVIDGPFLIGRHPENNMELEDRRASRVHAIIVPTAEGFRIRDLGSTNGTWVNGLKVQEVELQNGDEIQLGETSMIFTRVGRVEQDEPLDAKLMERLAGTIPEEPVRSDGALLEDTEQEGREPQRVARGGEERVSGLVTARKCDRCGHHEIGVTTEDGGFLPLKPGMKVEITGGD